MAYPESSDVSAGQPTASAHYNNLRKDAVYLGKTAAQAADLATLLSNYVQNIRLEYLATNRIRCPYDVFNPARIVINGYMLYQTANIDLALSQFSGAASTWYIFANQLTGSTAFALTVSTSSSPLANQRLIGECYWDGSNVDPTSVRSYIPGFPVADYDSGWFAVTIATVYTKAHNFGSYPRNWKLLWSSTSDGLGNNYDVLVVIDGNIAKSPIRMTTSIFTIKTGDSATSGTLCATNALSATGYYRILAWK
jgi:hypothetical protein